MITPQPKKCENYRNKIMESQILESCEDDACVGKWFYSVCFKHVSMFLLALFITHYANIKEGEMMFWTERF